MINKVYFVANHHGIQSFLSQYDHNDSNLILMYEQKVQLIQFIQELMPDAKLSLLPRMDVPQSHYFTYKDLGKRIPKDILFLAKIRLRSKRLFKDISPSANAYFYDDYDQAPFYVLLGCLSRKGASINYIDPFESRYEIIKKDVGVFQRLYLFALSIAGGVQLGWFQNKIRILAIGWKKYRKPVPYKADSWELLGNKYQWRLENVPPNAALIVDCNIFGRNFALDREKTEENLLDYFSRLLDRGIEIHLKPHPSDPEAISLANLPIYNQIEILPPYFPVELIMYSYSRVYYYFSYAASSPIDGKKYSLFNLLEFTKDGKKSRKKGQLELAFWREHNKIEYVKRVDRVEE